MFILCIETATPVCSIALLKDGEVTGLLESDRKNSHAEVITLFVQELLDAHRLDVSGLDAVAVSMGPGSYTGLRIGVSTAKGFCYAGDKPLIAVSTLQAMAAGAIKQVGNTDKKSLFCPMIDARRMEVYAALAVPRLRLYWQVPLSQIASEIAGQIEAVIWKRRFFGKQSDVCVLRGISHGLGGSHTGDARSDNHDLCNRLCSRSLCLGLRHRFEAVSGRSAHRAYVWCFRPIVHITAIQAAPAPR